MPEVYSVHQAVRSEGERQAGNMADQGSAADHIKLAMGEAMATVDYYRAMGKHCDPVLQVHDELIFELPRAELDEMRALAARLMPTLDLEVPLEIEMKVGATWGDLEK